ncbi:nuclear transport factor 2 family protein [Arthrobacter sp. FW305-BF8]|uniref:nuclear transport factor 2 family protein n=1 Tax=Arthrobacter sp. FW305-BF8 TaxID=2879617 RepID=UPI001F3A6616|nr:nuclear transport factor 2 family protein [Arthrobacter sp. FW305-BF8]UKA55219.1 nuclear transport factor 2 family protein [Arthrobacter sp. FW305-BF8]
MSHITADASVRNRLASIAHAADDGRTEDYVAMFTADAVWEIPSGTYVGHDKIRQVLETIAPARPQRHVVANTIVDAQDDHLHAVSDFLFLVHEPSGWVVAAVGRYHDEFRDEDGTLRLRRRTVRDQTPVAYMPTKVVNDNLSS